MTDRSEVEARVAEAPAVTSSGSRYAQHTLLSFTGLFVPLLVAVLLLPVAAGALGPARFGLLALAWATTEYLGMLELGTGRTAVRFIADALARRALHEIPQIASVSLGMQLLLGLLGGAAVVVAAPHVVQGFFHVPEALLAEATAMFLMVGVNVPLVLLINGLRSLLEGAERFGWSAAIRIPTSAASVAVPALGAVAGLSLPAIFGLLAATRAISCVVAAAAVMRGLPGFRWELPRQWSAARELFSFSKWVALSSVCSPILIYWDRFALGSIAGVAAVGFYAAPYEAATRFLLIPVSIVAMLFPALATMAARGETASANRLTATSVRQILLVMVVPAALLAAFAAFILREWIGVQYAAEAATALQVLAFGIVANALAHPPYVALYGANRPDLVARFHLAQVVAYLPMAWLLISRFGIVGAAASWTIRVTVDALLLFAGARRVTGLRFRDIAGPAGLLMPVAAATFVAAVFAVAASSAGLMFWIGGAMIALISYAYVAWRWLSTEMERAVVRRLLTSPTFGLPPRSPTVR